jgi:hypothetical protein
MAPFARKRPYACDLPENQHKKMGRPSSYRAEFCDQVVDYMGQGFSLTAFAGEIGHCVDSLYEWIGTHSDFSEAVKRGRAARVQALEKRLLSATNGGTASTSIFALKNADPTEWKEVRYATYDHNLKLETLSDEQLMAIAAGRHVENAGVLEVQYNRLFEKPKQVKPPSK